MVKVNQILAGAGINDAITNFAFEIQKVFQSKEISSEIFVPKKHIAPQYIENSSVLPVEKYKWAESSDILIYHYSIGSQATQIYKAAECRKVICYHNITPSFYFKNISKIQEEALYKGREELKILKDDSMIALSVSEFNRQELKTIGFKNTEIIPLKFPEEYLSVQPDTDIALKYKDGIKNLLFVGRVAPNKRFEDLIKIFYYYNKILNSSSRLILAGSYVGTEIYYNFLKFLISDLKLSGNVVFTGPLKLSTLIAYYKVSNAFVCASEHEGFCLPLIEAMHFKLPVFAFRKGAVPETLLNSGILFNEMNHHFIAEVIHYILERNDLLTNILAVQEKRIEEYKKSSLKNCLFEIFNKYFNLELK